MKAGDYVRTDTGQIGKITYFEGDMVRIDCDKFITYQSNHNEITKISPNIVDLIEVGDYVNGSKVTFVKDKGVYTEDATTYGESFWDLENIKSIVTKEQFSQMEYKL